MKNAFRNSTSLFPVRKWLMALTMLLGVAVFYACNNDEIHELTLEPVVVIHVDNLTLSASSVTLEKGNSETISVTISPTNASNKGVAWTSSNEAVATVDENGIITAVGVGEATVTATSKDGSKTVSCQVTVTETAEVKKQRQALTALYQAMNGEQWSERTAVNWCTNASLGEWKGVTMEDDKVTGLVLEEANMMGEIPAEIKDLTYLTHLTIESALLKGNSLTNLFQLKNLTSLTLSSCGIEEQLPASFYELTGLREVQITSCNLGDELKPDIAKLANLETLKLSNCNITGTIPEEITQLTQLTSLDLGYNKLKGDFAFISNMAQLKSLFLYGNLFEAIPSSIWTMANLEVLYLDNIDEIPESVGQMSALTELVIWDNNLTTLPDEFASLTNLKYIDIKGNFTEIPEVIGSLTQLESLDLSGAAIVSIPEWITQLTQLTDLSLMYNQIAGPLPEWIGTMTSLKSLNLYGNKITGDIPTSFYNLTNLTYLSLEGNRMTIQPTDELMNWLKGIEDAFIENQNSIEEVEGNESYEGHEIYWD